MIEKPIMMTPDNIEATDEDRKWMTRRQSGLKEINKDPGKWTWMSLNGTTQRAEMLHENGEILDVFPPFRRGDKLWIKEPHYVYGCWEPNGTTPMGKPSCRFYRSDTLTIPIFFEDTVTERIYNGYEPSNSRETGWHKRSAMFMPKKFTRKWLLVTEVKPPERVQDISDGDAIAEGHPWRGIGKELQLGYQEPLDWFEGIWESIYGEGSWKKNEWTWPIAFKKTEGPV